METFGMIVLTLLTVLGSAILGWLARRYALGGRCGPFGSDELANSLPDGTGRATGAIGTVAAGTAAVRYADDRVSAEATGQVPSGSGGATATKFSSGTGSDTVSTGPDASRDGTNTAGEGERESGASNAKGNALATTSASGSGAGSSRSSSQSKAEWFDGDATPIGSTIGNSGSGTPASGGGASSAAAAAVGTAGAIGTAATLVSGVGDDAKVDASSSSGTASSGSKSEASGLTSVAIRDSEPSSSDPAKTKSRDASSGDSSANASGSGLSARSNLAGSSRDGEAGSATATESTGHGVTARDGSSHGAANSATTGGTSGSGVTARDGSSASSNIAGSFDGEAAGSDRSATTTLAAGHGAAARDGSSIGTSENTRGGSSSSSSTGSAGSTSSTGMAGQGATALDGASGDRSANPAGDGVDGNGAPSNLVGSSHGGETGSAGSTTTADSAGHGATARAGSSGGSSQNASGTGSGSASPGRSTGSSGSTSETRVEAQGSTARDGASGDGSTNATGGGAGETSDSAGSSHSGTAGSAASATSGGTAGQGATARSGSDSRSDGSVEASRGSSPSSRVSTDTGGDGSTSALGVGSVSSVSTASGIAGAGIADVDGNDDDGALLVDIPSSLSAEEAEAERLLASDEEIAAPASRLAAPRSNQNPDDLTKIKGIGPKINGQLNDRGIYYYDQIADFSGSDLAWADRELGFKGRAVRDRWIPQARGLMDASVLEGSDTAATSKDEVSGAELTASQAEVRQLRTRLGLNPDSGSDANDSNKTDAERLEASQQEARELRQQLWSKEEAEKAETAKSTSAPASTSGSAGGAGAATGKVAAAGLGSFDELSPEEAEAERLIASGSAPKAASNSLDAPTPGFDPDDLTKIRGIGKPTQSRLNRKGIYYYDQIAGFTGSDLAWADKEMKLEGRVVSDRWIPQAKFLAGETDDADGSARPAADASATTDTSSDGDESEDVSLVDVPKALTAEEAEAERLLASGEEIAPPASRLDAPRSGQSPDDLTKIKGIGPKINGKLNDQGIYYYDQIAGFKGSDLAWADRELDFKGRAVRDRWVPQARGLMILSESTESVAPAPKTLLDKPIEGRSPDDLTAIKGIGNVLQKQLNEKGIYYYSQIAEFSDSDQEWANQTLGFPGRVERDDWIPQARELAASPDTGRAKRLGVLSDAGKQLGALSDNVEPGEMSGDETEAMRLIESGTFVADESNRPSSLLQSASEGDADDLQRIKGVGPKLNDLLNSLGIFYFRQIAEFSATDIAWVDSKLQFKGRIVRDRWVDQAKRLT